MIRANQTLRLKSGRTEAFDPVAGEILRVLRGRLWVTQTGQREDHFVGPGQWLALGRGRVVIEADLGVTAVYERRRVARGHAHRSEASSKALGFETRTPSPARASSCAKLANVPACASPVCPG
jgi:hypothetical protein